MTTIEIAPLNSTTFTDITPYLANNGLHWESSDIVADNATRTLDGIEHRGKVTDKVTLVLTCRPLTTSQTHILFPLIKQEYIKVKYLDPEAGETVTKTMFSDNRPAAFLKDVTDPLWNGIEFTLTEQ